MLGWCGIAMDFRACRHTTRDCEPSEKVQATMRSCSHAPLLASSVWARSPLVQPVSARWLFFQPCDRSPQPWRWFRSSFALARMPRPMAKNSCARAATTRRWIFQSCEPAARSHRVVQGSPVRLAEGSTGVRMGCRYALACSVRRRTTTAPAFARGRAWSRSSSMGRRALTETPSVELSRRGALLAGPQDSKIAPHVLGAPPQDWSMCRNVLFALPRINCGPGCPPSTAAAPWPQARSAPCQTARPNSNKTDPTSDTAASGPHFGTAFRTRISEPHFGPALLPGRSETWRRFLVTMVWPCPDASLSSRLVLHRLRSKTVRDMPRQSLRWRWRS